MRVTPVTDHRAWEAFLSAVQPPTFLQSWAWGETQRALGEDVVRLGAYEGETLVGVAQAATVTARRGKFLHLPHGPIVVGNRQQAVGSSGAASTLLHALVDEARRLELAFLRVSPIQDDTPEHREWYRALGFRPAPIHLHAERLWILDLAPSEDELLAGMRKTTRNLIRRAEREGVSVRFLNSAADLVPFFALYGETAAREHFVAFSEQAVRAEIVAFGSNVLVGIAEQAATPLAAAIVPLTAWSAFYHHGASSRLHPHVPAAYALQWALIREAKRRGCHWYNFWGISPGNRQQAAGNRTYPARPHPWSGLTLFKTGFGGREVPLVPTQDLPLSWRYGFAYAIDTLRRTRRRL